ncbi:MAG: M20/M25/M40 family metallo-hydrolase [Gemmatimonadales bacterium]
MRILTLLLVTAVTAPLAAQTATSPRARRMADEITFLASDSLQGRKTCEAGNLMAARQIAATLRASRLAPAGDSGTFIQNWRTGNTSVTREAGISGCNTLNVVGMLPGRGALAGQAVIMGAHFDHLGTGRFGSLAPDSGRIHHGADDNASGVALVLERARTLRQQGPRAARARRAIYFVLFSGEEEGDLGSAWFADHLPVPRDSVEAYLNFDMVGRLRERKLVVLGVRTAAEWPALVDSINAKAHLDVHASGDGWGPSDHASFYAKHIPVLMLFTDLHEQYHRPEDTADLINADGMVQVADFAANLVRRLMVRSTRLTLVDLPQPAPTASGDGRPRPTLGTIPDMSDEPGGVKLSGVRRGSPADSAGLRAGDVLTGIGDMVVANLQDFQNALMQHRPGDRVEIRFRRGDQTLTVTATLGGR